MTQTKRKRQPSRKRTTPYSTGELNSLIDDLIHPLKKIHPVFIFVDEALHMINEGDLEQSLTKFAKYSFEEVVRYFLKKDSK